MLRYCICVLLFCGFAIPAYALEDQGQPIHNEYHNSTIYYGSNAPQSSAEDDWRDGIHVYRDPETGDRITSVRARRQPVQNQPMPIFIQPDIRPHF